MLTENISGLLKERLNANDVFYLVDNPEISIKIEQRFISLGNAVAICDRWIPAINVKNKNGCEN